MSLRVWVRGLLIRWVWVRGLLSASGCGGGLLRVWVRSFLTPPRAGSGYGASSAPGSRLLNWIVFSFLGSCQFQMRPQAEMDADYFPPSEKSGPSTRVPTTPLKSLRPAEYGKRLVGMNLLCRIHSLWCHSSCIICCMQAYMYTVSKSPNFVYMIVNFPPLTPIHRHSTGCSVSTSESSCSRQRPLREHAL